MCSVIDNQKELKPCYFVIDKKFIDNKIQGHFEYMLAVAKSERKIERKKELIISSMGALVNFLSGVELTLPMVLSLAAGLVSVNVQIAQQLSNPKPRFADGGVMGITNLGEMTDEVILTKGRRILSHEETLKHIKPRQMSMYKYFSPNKK